MKTYLQFVKRLLLVVTPLLTSSVVAALPTQAATLALSKGELLFTNFSQSPLSTLTITDTNAEAIFQGGDVATIADAEASFTVFPPEAFNSSFSLAEGVNTDYSGFAESEASLIGSFSVEADKSFFFDFKAFLALQTSIDAAPQENAKAIGDMSWVLFDIDNNKVLDSFNIAGGLFTEDNNDFLKVNNSKNIVISNQKSESSFGGKEEFATVLVQGSLQRTFANTTNVALVEVKRNQVTVKAPEPSDNIALLISSGVIGIALKYRRKVNNACFLKE
ncbi:hypothetical protein FNW02_11710 [Komarekiella sp. 'clone 1']|uniref:PEP-CTERM sorting domain-containing protein n=1 Tax=Komarekiella delphini-convector SJRDD-AB1 TaxID=2593771 RepID=A0AA40VRP1_9NOST|nr:hypothetical protein [Komarekiella delphini-convector]MBD6616486.1 hypothetical protein [Komarekiella delphini-convector SJRDD-AB1]